MDWIAILRDQQADFIQRLKSSSAVLHQMRNYKLTGYHSESMLISGNLLNRLHKFYRSHQTEQLPDIYKQYINQNDFQERLKNSFSKLIVKQYLDSLIKTIDKNDSYSKKYTEVFCLTSNPNFTIIVQGMFGSRHRAKWSFDANDLAEEGAIVCVLLEEEVDKYNYQYNVIFAGFLPAFMLDRSQSLVSIKIEDLLYSGGLKSYLKLYQNISAEVALQTIEYNEKNALVTNTWFCTQTIIQEQSLLSMAISVNVSDISDNSPYLASGGLDEYIKIWDLRTGQVKQTLNQHHYPVFCLDFSPDGQTLAIGSMHETIELWYLGKGDRPPSLENLLEGHALGVFSLHFTPDGQMLISRSLEETIKIWDIKTGELIQTLDSHAGPIWSEAISPDGKILATGNLDETIKIWNLDKNSGELNASELYTLDGHSDIVRCLAFSPDGQFMASGSGDRTIKIWRVSDPTEKPSVIGTLNGHSDVVHSLGFSPDGKILASGSADCTINLWHLGDETNNYVASLVTTLTNHSGLVWAVKFTPDGKTLVSGSQDGSIKIWHRC